MADLFRTRDSKVQVQANQLNADNALALSVWCSGGLVQEHDALQHDKVFAAINVPTSVGFRRAQEGDWIIYNEKVGFYPVPPAKFEEMFEAVVDG